MYPPPTGHEPDAATCRELDDHFFSSDPAGYFRSKIDALLNWFDDEEVSLRGPGPTWERFQRAIGSAAFARHPTTLEQRKLQVAADAVQLRHQVAETLLRFVHARLICRELTDPSSLWVQLTNGPTQLKPLLEALARQVERDDYASVLAGLIFPLPGGTKLDKTRWAALQNASEWLQRAAELVSSGDISLNAASNKLKHGVAVRPEDRLRVTFTTQPPDEEGNVYLSSLTGESAIDVFDTIVLEYLSRPPKEPGQEPHGLERTLLRVDTPVVLAEAWMMALVHGAMFHTAAYRHHGDQIPPGVADHPGLALNMNPAKLLGLRAVGMRFPVTTTRSGRVPRPAGIGLTDGTFLTLTFGDKQSGRVVAS